MACPSALPLCVLLVAAAAWPRESHAAAARAPAGAAAARADSVRAALRGVVIDAATAEPLVGVVVVLTPQPEGAVAPGAAVGASAYLAGARRARTDSAGRYQFEGLAAGMYRLYAARVGYTAAAVDVTLAGAAPEVSLGLTVAPLALRPVEVRARGAAPGAGGRAGVRAAAGGGSRVLAALERQRAYLATDVRELTATDVDEAVTLAETDLLRALHRLPGVSTRDEWAAELWTRGARADQTRVSFDGVPLYSPLHAYGALGAVNPDAVGAAFLHPGVRPAALAEGGAAVLDLRSRAGRRDSTGGLAGAGELAVTSARLTLASTADDDG